MKRLSSLMVSFSKTSFKRNEHGTDKDKNSLPQMSNQHLQYSHRLFLSRIVRIGRRN